MDQGMNSLQFHTFGCKVNTYDTGLLQQSLRGPSDGGHGVVHVLNTCAVTAEATKDAIRLIRRIKARDPQARIVVTGCAAQVDTHCFSELPGVDLVIANSHKGQIREILTKFLHGDLPSDAKSEPSLARVFKSNIFRKEDLEAGGGLEEKHSRAFLKIQDGCNSFCSYCIIPFARGKSRSIPVAELVRRVQELQEQNISEVVLTGIHIGDYEDGVRRLEDLIEALLRRTAIPRLRLTSLEPVEVSDRLLELFADERLCSHFHLSIQSGSSPVLRAMKRKYGQEEVRRCLETIGHRYPSAFVGMDLIAGFPSESEDDFTATFGLLNECPWTKIHVFPYSEREGTMAATFDQLPMSTRKHRARRFRELSHQRLQQRAARQVGQLKRVLLLQQRGQRQMALSRDYWNLELSHAPASGLAAGLAAGGEFLARVTGFRRDMPQILEGVYERT
ncbi:MAG: tRNA (N(6)-L-threonylcarbamoyladenosine(37)-C(2))-methylthiotransferase MtaB [Bdellovibrio sp.]|nr:MAG: tRNA (N(6)-L-threonylcarbamoyladenosine(37)-C(2))-methylthiotransferase MtaB [Bdellovibrio sp.]